VLGYQLTASLSSGKRPPTGSKYVSGSDGGEVLGMRAAVDPEAAPTTMA
jgi:hypothetical protein